MEDGRKWSGVVFIAPADLRDLTSRPSLKHQSSYHPVLSSRSIVARAFLRTHLYSAIKRLESCPFSSLHLHNGKENPVGTKSYISNSLLFVVRLVVEEAGTDSVQHAEMLDLA